VENVAAHRSNGGVLEHAFELLGGHPALDLVNTLDWRFRDAPPPVELLRSYSDLVRFADLSGLLNRPLAGRLLRNTSESKAAPIMAAVRELREAAAQVSYAALEQARPPASAIKTLETYFMQARQAEKLSWAGTKLAWQFENSASAPELPLWLLARSTADLLTSDEMSMLRECGNPECRWLFLDTSKNHTRRWCDMKICGNRMKARRFKAQHRA
jgi:predicted RNA-binding Zn ribbon-like protein